MGSVCENGDGPPNDSRSRSASAIILELSILSDILNESARIRNAEPPPPKQSFTASNYHVKDMKKSFIGRVKFVISCIGYSVGLGNIWRFPYLCYTHGGGSFLIAYAIMLALVGLPLFLLEVTLGQYSGRGPVLVFANVCPLFGGLGPAMLSVSFLVIVYYNLLLSWTLFYLFASFVKRLPWESCDPTWSSPECYTSNQDAECRAKNMTFWNSSCHGIVELCELKGFNAVDSNATLSGCVNGSVLNKISAAEDFFVNKVLGTTSGIDDVGRLRWQLAFCLFLASFLVFVCLIRGTYSSSKVIYFTAVLPCVILVVLCLKSFTLDGAMQGILFYLTPQFPHFLNPQLWGDAAVHVIFSLGPAFGGLISLSSYNGFYNNCLRDSLVVVFCDAATSLFSGFVIFSVIGHMSQELTVPIEDVVHSGPVMAFIAYPEAITRLSSSSLWSFLFFLMLLTLGVDSLYTAVESIRTSIEDVWPSMLQCRIELLSFICCVFYVLGLPLTTEAGVYIFTLFDQYTTNWSVLLIGILECVVAMWIYGNNANGASKLKHHLEEMIGSKCSDYWFVCWKAVTPALLVVLLVSQWLTHSPLRYGDYEYPLWADMLGWLLSFAPVSIVPIWATYLFMTNRKSTQPLSHLLKSTKEWGRSSLGSSSSSIGNAAH